MQNPFYTHRYQAILVICSFSFRRMVSIGNILEKIKLAFPVNRCRDNLEVKSFFVIRLYAVQVVSVKCMCL